MRRKVLLSSLSVGRCFTPAVEPGGAGAEVEEREGGATRTAPVLKPGDAWKVTGQDGDDVSAESAEGQAKTFGANSEVVEIPRQGFDRLVEQAG